MRFFPSQRLHLKRRFHGSFALLGLLCFGFEANAQKPVYRCETAGVDADRKLSHFLV